HLVVHQRAAAVRRGVLHHQGRAWHRDLRGRLLPVQPGLPARRGRLRRGHRLRPAHRHPVPHPDPALGRPAARLLRLMTRRTAIPAPAPRRDPAAREPGEERERGQFLFSPWHLILIPIALVMLIPMAWMLVTSLETLSEVRHFPPPLLPSTLHLSNYTDVLRQAPFARWFVNTVIVTVASVAGNLLFCSLAGYAFARIRFFGREVVFVLILATLM